MLVHCGRVQNWMICASPCCKTFRPLTANIRRSGASSPCKSVMVGDPAAACWWHGGFGLRGVLSTVVGIRDRIRRLGVGREAARRRATESDSSSGSVSGSVTLCQADSGPAIT
jgi:hypothetical protein